MEIKSKRIEYKSWSIILACSEGFWSFCCCPIDGEPLINHERYIDERTAYLQAVRFIERRIIRKEIDAVLDPLVELGVLYPSTYAHLLRLIGKLMRL